MFKRQIELEFRSVVFGSFYAIKSFLRLSGRKYLLRNSSVLEKHDTKQGKFS